MKGTHKKIIAGLSALLILLGSQLSLAGRPSADNNITLFRYKNLQGTTVTSHILPPEFAVRGYEVINQAGDVIKKVAPAPTEEEKEELLRQRAQEKYDKDLLLRYGSLADLMNVQERRQEESTAKLMSLKSNLSNIKLQIEAEQSKAANYERQGRQIPDTVITNLEQLYGNLEKTEDLIRQRQKELDDEKARYVVELDRYKELKGLK